MIDQNALAAFVERAGLLTAGDGTIDHFGVSRIWRGAMGTRRFDIGTNGSRFWVTVDIAAGCIPENVAIASAPIDGYAREKHLEDGKAPIRTTGDSEFDSLFLVFVEEQARVTEWPGTGMRRAFVEAADLHPSLSWLDPLAFVRRSHLKCEPSMHLGTPGQWHELGSGAFTPERARDAALRLIQLAMRVEAIDDPMGP